jgi:hypothetical protein
MSHRKQQKKTTNTAFQEQHISTKFIHNKPEVNKKPLVHEMQTLTNLVNDEEKQIEVSQFLYW